MRQIVKAEAAPRRPFNVFIYGPTKAGKTTAAWLAAMRIVGLKGSGVERILFIDTESGRSTYILDKYPELADASVLHWEPPFSVAELTRTLKEQQDNYDVIVIDSFSAFYSREGGTLDHVNKETARLSGNSYVAWKKPGEEYSALLTAITQLRCSVIVCARAKMQYEQAEEVVNGRTKKAVVAIGVGPIVRTAETAYELDLEIEVGLDNDGGRFAVVKGSRIDAIPAGTFYGGGFDPQVVDLFLDTMSGRRDIERPVALTISAEDFLTQWKDLFDNEDDARTALAKSRKWSELRDDGIALARLLADRKVARAAEQEKVAVEPDPAEATEE